VQNSFNSLESTWCLVDIAAGVWKITSLGDMYISLGEILDEILGMRSGLRRLICFDVRCHHQKPGILVELLRPMAFTALWR